ncbi:uncharacterized protein C12orf71 homolog [Macrotis lagotis]|uniref:uncharacterized protein C12orf71 homolog n=1 Tax=Macrotis lagotis TaxID=92651 RepID=UPI003D6985D3
MATLSSQSDSTDTEISSSESNISLSVGYYPSQETNSFEETSPTRSSIHFLPPIQGAWLTKTKRRPKRRCSQVQNNLEQFSKLSITLAWDIDQSNSVCDLDLKRESNWADMKREQNTFQTMGALDCFVQNLETDIQTKDTPVPGLLPKEDSQITLVSNLETTKNATKSIHNEDTFQDSSIHQLPENQYLVQPVMPQECQHGETKEMGTWQYRKETPNYKNKRTSSRESSSLSIGKREYQPHPSPAIQPLSFLNIGRFLCWLREQVTSSFSGKEPSQNKDTNGTKLLAQKRHHSCRERRVQPENTPKSTYL